MDKTATFLKTLRQIAQYENEECTIDLKNETIKLGPDTYNFSALNTEEGIEQATFFLIQNLGNRKAIKTMTKALEGVTNEF